MLITLPDLKLAAGVSGSAEDARLELLLLAADRWVKNFCGREFESARAVEFYSGTGTRLLVLKRRPVTAVHEVLENRYGHYGDTLSADGGFSTADTLVAGTDYAVVRDRQTSADAPAAILERLSASWPMSYTTARTGLLSAEAVPGLGNLRVDYTAGYAAGSIPRDLQVAVAMVAAHWRRAVPYGGGTVVREQLGRWEYELANLVGRYGVPDGVTGILAAYREPLM
jgi:hypothetical protein